MASSFTTSFGIEKITTGEQSGSWGTTTNYNIDILDRIASYKSIALSDSATATLTVRAGSPSDGGNNVQDGMYRVIKFTGTLSQACTITIAPTTTTAYFIIENGTSGSQNIIMAQGSAAQTVTIAAGKADIVYADGSDEVISIASKLGVNFDVVDDTTPQLGGNLDVNGNSIVSASNGNISITPNGSGKVILDGLSHPTSDGSAGQFLKTDGSANLSFATVSTDVVSDTSPQLGGDLDVNGNSIVSTSNANINITPNGTGDVNLGADTVMVGDNNADATITTQGTGDLTLNTNSGTNSGTITIADGANGNISITPNGSGNIVLDGLTFPNADGSADQVLATNGSGTLSFAAAGGGKVLQVVTAQKNDSFTTSSNSFVEITDLSVNITPSATSSKVLIMASVSAQPGTSDTGTTQLTIFEGSTNIIDSLKDSSSAGSRSGMFMSMSPPVTGTDRGYNTFNYHLLRSPSTTSQLTYSVRGIGYSTQTLTINRVNNPDNIALRPFGVSSITVMEIGA